MRELGYGVYALCRPLHFVFVAIAESLLSYGAQCHLLLCSNFWGIGCIYCCMQGCRNWDKVVQTTEMNSHRFMSAGRFSGHVKRHGHAESMRIYNRDKICQKQALDVCTPLLSAVAVLKLIPIEFKGALLVQSLLQCLFFGGNPLHVWSYQSYYFHCDWRANSLDTRRSSICL